MTPWLNVRADVAHGAKFTNRASKLIGVWSGGPSGTKNTIDYAASQDVPVEIIEV